ncbi:MAG: hypothetical protein ACK4WH_02300 [Phycisphaerales bacterium]
MRLNRRFLSAASAAALCMAVGTAANGQCVDYTVATGPATFIAGDTDIGNHCDDCVTSVTFPFPVSLYGVSYFSANASSNGNLQFVSALGSFGNLCLPWAAGGPTIFPLWDDLYTTTIGSGQGIFTSVSGTSPNQVFSIEWRAQNCCSAAAPVHNFCVIFYESETYFDIVYNTVDGATGTDSTVGVQASGTGPQTQYWCNTTGVGAPTSGLSLRFTCAAVAPDGSCCTAGVCTVTQQVDCAAPGVWTTGGVCDPNPCPQPPSNDLCENATTVTVGAPAATGTNLLANTDPGEVFSCQALSENGVWFDFTAGALGGAYQFDTQGSPQPDTILAIYDACNGLELACDDDSGVTPGLSSLLTIVLSPNQNVKVLLGTYAPNTPGGYVLNITEIGSGACCNTLSNECTITAANSCVGGTYQGNDTVCDPTPCPAGVCCASDGSCSVASGACPGGSTFQAGGVCSPNPCPQPLPNDDCETAEIVSVGSPAATGDSTLALTDPYNLSCAFLGDPTGKDVWFSFTAGPSGGTYEINTNNSSYDTVMSIFDACPAGGGLEIACDDDTGLPGLQSAITITLAANQTILISVDGWNEASGNYILNIIELGTGACCNNLTGDCTITASNACTGGTFQGNDTVCESTACPTGACCNNTSGACSLGGSTCPSGSTYQGAGTSCGPTTCADFGVGACCDGTNCTIVVGAANCVGTFQGAGTICGGPVYDITTGGGAFTSIAGTGTLLATVSACDDCGETVALPFFFSFLGTSYSDVWVTSNGFIQFGGANNVNFINAPIPTAGTPDTFLAPLWDDLNPGAAGDIYAQVDGVSPNQTFTISWEGCTQFALTTNENFQVVLFENGNVEFRYGDITAETFAGDYTVGYEDGAGTAGRSVPGADLLTGNTALTLTPNNVTGPCDVVPTEGACCCGSSCSISTAAACSGTNQSFAGVGTACNPFPNTTAPCCRANFNKIGGVTVQDIFDYLSGYFASPVNLCADTNDTGTVTVQDIFDYLTAYFGPTCP